MSRKFVNEIKELQTTLDWTFSADTHMLSEFICRNDQRPILVVGSGGSFSMASAIAQLVVELGGFAKAVTPVGMVAEISIKNCAVILVSARGNNNDVVNSYKYLLEQHVIDLLLLCFNERSKVVRALDDKGFGVRAVYTLPHPKDGFLAMNSIMATLGLLQRLYAQRYPNDDVCRSVITNVDCPLDLIQMPTIIAIAGVNTMPVANDFMVKCAETGLVNVQPCDFRTFVHGRHNWIARRVQETGIVAFSNKSDRMRLESVLDRIPNAPKACIHSRFSGTPSLVDLFPKMFVLVKKLGDASGIDPGHPHVEDFGVRLYHTSCSYKALAKGCRHD